MTTYLYSGDFAAFGQDSAFFEEVRRQRIAQEQGRAEIKQQLAPLFIGGVLLASQHISNGHGQRFGTEAVK